MSRQPDIDHLRVRYRRTDSPGSWTYLNNVHPSGGNVALTEGIERNVAYTIQAQSVSSCGAASAWVAVSHTAAASTETPPTPTDPAAESVTEGIHLTWTVPQSAADVQTQIHRAPDNGGAPGGFALLTTLKSEKITDAITDGRVFWYRFRTIDYRGNVSPFSAEVSARAGLVADSFGGRGVNLIPPRYASTYPPVRANLFPAEPPLFDENATHQLTAGYFPNSFAFEVTTTELAAGGPGATGPVANPSFVAFAADTGTYNIDLAPGKKYILSAYVKPTTYGVGAAAYLQVKTASGVYARVDFTLPASQSWARVYGLIDLSSDTANAALLLAAMAIENSGYALDGLMLEEQLGNQTLPSAYAQPAGAGGASLDQITDGANRYAAAEAGADKTANNTAAAIASQGALATRNSADWGSMVAGFGKPADNADVTAQSPQTIGWLNDGANVVQAGHSITRLSGRDLTNIGDAGGRYAAVHSGGQQTIIAANAAAAYAPGDNLLTNPSAVLGNLYWPGTIGGKALHPSSTKYWYGVADGTDQGIISTPFVMGANVALVLSGEMDAHAASGGYLALFAQFLDSAGSEISRAQLSAALGDGWTRYTQALTSPPGTVSMRVFMRANATGGGNVAWRRLKVETGTVASPFNDFATQVGNQLVQPGSNVRLGNQANAPMTTIGNLRSRWDRTGRYAYPDHYNYPTSTLRLGSISRTYGNGSVGGLAASTTYNAYFIDPDYAGGSRTMNATTDPNVLLSRDDIAYYETFTTAASGTTSPPPTSGGGGGGIPPSECVCVGMWLDHKLKVEEAPLGYEVEGIADDWSFSRRKLIFSYRATSLCVLLHAANGAKLACSVTTPFVQPNGWVFVAMEMLGKEVMTDQGLTSIIRIDWLGKQPVMRQSFGGISFPAGVDPSKRMFSHNITQTSKP